MKVDKFAHMKNWDKWVDHEVIKHSGKPFKSGLKIGIPKGLTINIHSTKQAFLMDDDSVVDCHQCVLLTNTIEL